MNSTDEESEDEDLIDDEEEEEDLGGLVQELPGVIGDMLRRYVRQLEGDDDDVHDDESSSSEDEDGIANILGSNSTTTTFDTALPTSHSYLGSDLEVLQGRTVHADGDIVLLPLFHLDGIVVVPGQILPLNLSHPQAISMMRRVIAADKTFGLLISKPGSQQRHEYAPVGVTCEICSVKEEESYGIAHMILKTEGRQRFRIISKQHQLDGVILGKIRILPDAYISPQPFESMICSQRYPQPNAVRSQLVANRFYLNHKKFSCSEQRYLAGFNPKHAQLLCTSLTSIQGWTFKLYNPYFLMDCLLHEIRSWNQNLQFDNIPQNPIDFSFWITKNLPLTNEMKVELLEIDSAPLRMRKQIDFMNKFGSGLACERCGSLITDKNEIFSLSKRGPMGAFVNPGGHVHETVTFYKVNNLSLQGRASEEYSWFPGYAWTIALCKTCRRHMGWKFTSTNKELKPKKFWGLTRAALRPVFKESVATQDKEEKPSRDLTNSGRRENRGVQNESNI